MFSQDTTRYSLRSQTDISVDDLQDRGKRLSTIQSDILDCHHSNSAMGREGDRIPFSIRPSTRHGGNFSNTLSTLQWNEQKGLGGPSNGLYESLSAQEVYEMFDGSVYGQDSNGIGFRDLHWDDGMPHNQREVYSSMTCPRTFGQETDRAVKTAVGSALQAHPPSAYYLDPSKHLAPSSMLPYHQNQFEHSDLPEMSSMYPSLEPSSIYSPALSRSLSQSTRAEMCQAITPEPTDSYEIISDPADLHIEEIDADGGVNSEPYAQLIYRALKSAKDHRMVLKEIYKWFEKHTDKAKNTDSKGWQNSIRHNLSMNGAFKKVDQAPPSDESKKGFIWVLEPSAIANGVESTTRYRRTIPGKKPGKNKPAATQRQRSGAKGGKATRHAKLRKASKNAKYHPKIFEEDQPAFSEFEYDPAIDISLYDLGNSRVPYYLHASSSTGPSSNSDTSPYSYADITGCVDGMEGEPLFYSDFENGTDPTLPSSSLCELSENLLYNFNYST